MVRQMSFGCVTAVVAICAARTAPATNDLNFSCYTLRGDVWQESLGSDFQCITSDAPSGPISEIIDLEIGPAALTAAYDLCFDADSILLSAHSQQAIAYDHPWGCGARARAAAVITATMPVEVRVEASFTYDFTGWDADGDTYLGLTFEIVSIESQTVLHTVDASPVVLPGAGSATLDAAFILPAGGPYNIGFDSFTYTFRDIDGSTASVESDVSITIRTVPEAATGACLLAAACTLGRRR